MIDLKKQLKELFKVEDVTIIHDANVKNAWLDKKFIEITFNHIDILCKVNENYETKNGHGKTIRTLDVLILK